MPPHPATSETTDHMYIGLVAVGNLASLADDCSHLLFAGHYYTLDQCGT